MGCVQAKPGRRRPVLERNTSFAITQQVFPIIIRSDFSRVLAEYMGSYQSDCEHDKELRDIDAKLRTGAEQVVMGNTTFVHRLNKGVEFLTQYEEMVKSVMATLTQKILEAKGKEEIKVMTENEKLVDDMVMPYLHNNSDMLQLCTVELLNLVKSARGVHSCMADRLRERQLLKNNIKSKIIKYHHSVEEVVKKLTLLRNLHIDMLMKLKDRILKLDNKLELAGTLKKVVNVVFIGLISSAFVCTVLAAAMAAPPVASAFSIHPCIAGLVASGAVINVLSPAVKKGRHWLLDLCQVYESTLEVQKGLIKSMEAGTRDAIKELDDLISQVDKVIARGNDPVLCKLSSLMIDEDKPEYRIEDLEVIIQKLADFDQEIEELDKKRNECIKIVEEAEEKVGKDYAKLKEALKSKSKK